MIPEPSIFDENLACLEGQRRHAGLAAWLRKTVVNPLAGLEWHQASEGGEPVPTAMVQGRPMALVSRHQPRTEASRMAAAQDRCSLLVLVGCGAGYLPEAIKARMAVDRICERLLVVEFMPELLAGTLRQRRLSHLLGDPRITVGMVSDEAGIRDLIERHYLPQLHPSIRILFAPPAQRLAAACNLPIETWLAAAVSAIQGDFITQSRFGRLWLHNIACNLTGLSAAPSMQLESKHPVWAVLGAGPSLERSLPEIRSLQASGVRVLSCDASLAFCRRHGIEADLVMSIDGQCITYLHLLSAVRHGAWRALPRRILDLAATPVWARTGDGICFAGSRHPLIDYFRLEGLDLPELDTQGGNVGHCMTAWAAAHGAETIHVFGLDFAYLRGMPYARPGFFYDDAERVSDRLSPLEHRVAGLWLGQDLAAGGRDVGRRVTVRLGEYRRRFEAFAAGLPCRVIDHGQVPSLCLGGQSRPAAMRLTEFARTSAADPAGLCHSYLATLSEAAFGDSDPLEIWENGDTRERRILATLLPLMAYELAFLLKCEGQNSDIRRKAFLAAKEHTRTVMTRFFS
jgi:hypothetical protein